MKSIHESPITTLQIVKPDFVKKYYEIKSGDDLYGTVELLNNAGTLSRIETMNGSFTVKRCGFFKPYITLRKEKSTTDETIVYLNMNGNTQMIINGEEFNFCMVNLWKNQWGWMNARHQVVVRYKPTVAGTIKGDVEVSKDFTYSPSIELIAILGVYFLTHLEDEVLRANEYIHR
jgi:hypothetical protein